MKGLALLLATVSIAVPSHSTHAKHPLRRCTTITHQVWKKSRWRRERPKKSAIIGWRRMRCPKAPWLKAKKRFYKHRSKMRWLAKYRPFIYPDGTRWAVPYPIAICESGENYDVGPSGAYGLIPPFPQWMSPREQDEVAANLFRELGDAPWAPYEGGCYLR